MYRKVIFLLLNLSQLNINIKTSILLFVSYFSVYTTKICSPFFSKELNKLELTSNVTACIILYSGTLYSEDIGAPLQALIFIVIMIANTIFFILALFSLVRIVVITNITKIKLYFPRFTVYYFYFLQVVKNFSGKKKVKKLMTFHSKKFNML